MSVPANTAVPASTAVPPKLAATRPRTSLALVIGGAAALGAGALLFQFDPAGHAFYPRCFFHQTTGLNCPGCGGLRAAHQLLHGHLPAALHLNALAVVLLPLFASFMWSEFAGLRRGMSRRHLISARSVWCLVGLSVVFTVLRNLPAFAFLAP